MSEQVEIVGETQIKNNGIFQDHYFSSGIYTSQHPEFLNEVKVISKKFIDIRKKESVIDKRHPIISSSNLINEEKLKPISNQILKMASSVLMMQGYDINLYETVLFELWSQEHQQYSGQEEHIHPHYQISGFYFINVPENPEDCPRIVFHDPRAVKVYSGLSEANPLNGTYASSMINYVPEPGQMMMTNSWLSHSLTKNPSKTSFTFLHFNVGIALRPPKSVEKVEVV
jgi:uncharacterized protein (TIGR02466 family)